MNDIKFMRNCQLCNASYQMGPHRYDGKRIPKYQLDVCGNCYKASWDGWGPYYENIILAHLERLGLSVPERQPDGYLPRD